MNPCKDKGCPIYEACEMTVNNDPDNERCLFHGQYILDDCNLDENYIRILKAMLRGEWLCSNCQHNSVTDTGAFYCEEQQEYVGAACALWRMRDDRRKKWGHLGTIWSSVSLGDGAARARRRMKEVGW